MNEVIQEVCHISSGYIVWSYAHQTAKVHQTDNIVVGGHAIWRSCRELIHYHLNRQLKDVLIRGLFLYLQMEFFTIWHFVTLACRDRLYHRINKAGSVSPPYVYWKTALKLAYSICSPTWTAISEKRVFRRSYRGLIMVFHASHQRTVQIFRWHIVLMGLQRQNNEDVPKHHDNS